MNFQLIAYVRVKAARKEHRCIWCGEPILAGESYTREFSKYCGDTQDMKWHRECRAASCEWFRQHGGESEFDPGMFKRGTCDER